MTQSVLELSSIKKEFTQGDAVVRVLKDINLTLKRGSVTAITGPSGAGKSTLLHIAALLEPPTRGDIHLHGRAITRATNDQERSAIRRHKMGFVYQYHHLLGEFSALENVMMPALLCGHAVADAKKQSATLLKTLGLAHRFNHLPHALSGGEQQRVAIARAVAHAPTLLFADEPTGNLDGESAQDVFKLFVEKARNAGVTLLLATHNARLAQIADAHYRLEGGVLLA